MAVRIVLENAKAQLEAQKKREYAAAKEARLAELQTEYNEFKAEKDSELADAISELKAAYEAAVVAKQTQHDKVVSDREAEINRKAEEYATVKAAVLDGLIVDLQRMIDKTEG